MIDLIDGHLADPRIHRLPTDPGDHWVRSPQPAIEAPPDSDSNPAPDARWPETALHTGICGTVSPRVIRLPGGDYRMYYSQILPRAGYPAGANDYDYSTTRILSAYSAEGERWIPDPGVRLTPQDGGAGDFRVVSSDVAPGIGGPRWRMYYEACPGPQSGPSTILSAASDDGVSWTREAGVRLEIPGHNLSSPRVVFLADDRCRLFFLDRGHGILSAVSHDGLHFDVEPGVRIAPGPGADALIAFAPEIFQISAHGWVMYYAGYANRQRASILRAESTDGLTWNKQPQPVLSPGGRWDQAKCSEMCVYPLPMSSGSRPRYGLVYEACDGTAVDQRGVWRIAQAVSAG